MCDSDFDFNSEYNDYNDEFIDDIHSMIDLSMLTNVCEKSMKNSEIGLICGFIMNIVNSANDINISTFKLMKMGFNIEDYPVETGKKGQFWRVGKEYCIQLSDSRNSPRMAYCALIKIADIPKHIRKMKLSKLFQIK